MRERYFSLNSLIVACGLLVFLHGPLVASKEIGVAQWPDFHTSPQQAREFKLISHLSYRELKYRPPHTVVPAKMEGDRYSGPESLAAAQISAMLAGDVDWWLNTWEPDSREFISAKITEAGDKGRKVLVDRWAERLIGAHVEFVRWLETGRYIVITYRSLKDGRKAEEFPVVIGLYPEGWRATLALSNSPLVTHINDRKDKIIENVR